MKTTSYVRCPICGAQDTVRVDYGNGGSYIDCHNPGCASNGGSNWSAWKARQDEAAKEYSSIQLTVEVKGSSGIEIRAPLKEKYNCVEYTLNDMPQPVFISPWMQWEPAKMQEERTKIALEIVRRVMLVNISNWFSNEGVV